MAAISGCIDDASIKKLASQEDYQHGNQLAQSEVVEIIEMSPLKVRAQVKDNASQSYVEVKLIAAMGRLIHTCTCGQTGFCQHCVAAAMATNRELAIRRSEQILP